MRMVLVSSWESTLEEPYPSSLDEAGEQASLGPGLLLP